MVARAHSNCTVPTVHLEYRRKGNDLAIVLFDTINASVPSARRARCT